MKRTIICFFSILLLLSTINPAMASLTVIGTAQYDDGSGTKTYKLIYDNDLPGNGTQGLVWLDYQHETDTWQNQVDWASGVGSHLTITLNPGYVANFDWATGWRLPSTVDGPYEYGYEGDPDGDGVYSYTAGYNLANSEMGHLFYTELGNLGQLDTDGNERDGMDYGLRNRGEFEHLFSTWYWSGTVYSSVENYAWYFSMYYGNQDIYGLSTTNYALAVHPGTVSTVPIPGGVWLLGSGLLSLMGIRRRKTAGQGFQ